MLRKKSEKRDIKEKGRVLLDIDLEEKEKFKKLCRDNDFTMSEVLSYTIKQINKKGDFTNVNFRAAE